MVNSPCEHTVQPSQRLNSARQKKIRTSMVRVARLLGLSCFFRHRLRAKVSDLKYLALSSFKD